MDKGFFSKLKAESKEAACRVAGTQVIKATKAGLLKTLRSRGINNKQVNAVSEFLDTDLGTALLSTIIGVMFTHLPKFKHDKRAQSIAKEFRVGGMALAGNLLAHKAVTDLLPVIESIVDNLPSVPLLKQPTRVRVPTPTEPAEQHEELEVEQLYSKEHYKLDVWN